MDIDYSVEEQPLGTAGSVRLAQRAPRRDLPRHLRRRALRRRPDRPRRGAPREGRRGHDRPQVGGQPARVRDRRHRRGRARRAVPREALVGPGVLRHDQHGDLRPRAGGAPPRARTTGPYDFSKELFPLLLEMGRPIYGHVLDGYWQDIGNLEQFRQANFDALDGARAARRARPRLRGNVWVSEEVDINEVEGVEGPAFIGANCRIADGASIGPYSVLSQGVIVREGASVDAERRRRRHVPRPERGRRGRDRRPRLRPA